MELHGDKVQSDTVNFVWNNYSPYKIQKYSLKFNGITIHRKALNETLKCWISFLGSTASVHQQHCRAIPSCVGDGWWWSHYHSLSLPPTRGPSTRWPPRAYVSLHIKCWTSKNTYEIFGLVDVQPTFVRGYVVYC